MCLEVTAQRAGTGCGGGAGPGQGGGQALVHSGVFLSDELSSHHTVCLVQDTFRQVVGIQAGPWSVRHKDACQFSVSQGGQQGWSQVTAGGGEAAFICSLRGDPPQSRPSCSLLPHLEKGDNRGSMSLENTQRK